MIWLGQERGYLSDYVTQAWVRLTGRRVEGPSFPWLGGPVGATELIGVNFFEQLAAKNGLRIQPGKGLISDFQSLSGPTCDPSVLRGGVIRFYENTNIYELDAWSDWCGAFKPFGRLLALFFSRRLQQLNVPLSGIDTSAGITSDVFDVVEPSSGSVVYTAWVRQLLKSKNVLYAGSYSICTVPGATGPCIKVAFPLPNGNAIVIMQTKSHVDGSFSVTSSGKGFGDPGFYFTVHNRGRVWARYVRALRETIHVFEIDESEVRADHTLEFWGMTFLRLHYRLRQTKKRRDREL